MMGEPFDGRQELSRQGYRSPLATLGICIASALVLMACAFASFRVGFGESPTAVLQINGPRVLLAMASGALFASSGVLRLLAGAERPLRELEWLGLSAGAAGGGFWLAQSGSGLSAPALFCLGAVAGGGLLFAAARALGVAKRWTNLGVLLLLAVAIASAALAGTYSRARPDLVAPLVSWLLGDLDGATAASGTALILVAIVFVAIARRNLPGPGASRATALAWLGFGLGLGAVGPLAFVGGMVPRTVRWLGAARTPGAWVVTSAVAGGATVAAIDTVPRLLLGGYGFPFNIAAAVLAVPIFLGWNRARLRKEVGPASRAFEVAELVLIVVATLAAAGLAAQLTLVVRSAT